MKSVLSSISFKIAMGYAAVLVITLIAAFALNTSSSTVKREVSQFIEVTLPELEQVELLQSITNELVLSAYSLYGTTTNVAQFSSTYKEAEKKLQASVVQLKTMDSQFDATPLEVELTKFRGDLQALKNTMAARSINWDGARDQLSQISGRVAVIEELLQSHKQHISQTATASSQRIFTKMSDALTLNWLMVAVIVAVAVMAYVYSRKQVVAPVTALAKQMGQVAESLDLTVKLPANSNDEVGMVARGVSRLLSVFGDGIQDVLETSRGISEAVKSLGQVSHQAEDSVCRLNGEIDQLVDQMIQLDGRIETGVASSTSASEAAQQGAAEVAQGAQEVGRTSDSISALADDMEATASMLLTLRSSGDQVSTVVSTIAEIADQTNLLALNAAIEAARAGESGRGFAVVADEVRTLANRTHQSTVEINTMLESIVSSITAAVDNMSSNQEKAKQSVSFSRSTVQSLSAIQETILGLSQQCIDVAAATKLVQQEVVQARDQVNQFKAMGATVAQGSEQTQAAAAQLSELVQRLDELSSKFKV